MKAPAGPSVTIISIMQGQTRYGSPRVPAASACAVLRARAAKNVKDLRMVDVVDMAASALSADAWVAITGSSDMTEAYKYGPDAVKVLAACLSRACGYPGEYDKDYWKQGSPSLPTSDDYLVLLKDHQGWAAEMCPTAYNLVLAKAGADLLAAGDNNDYGRYGALLILVAEQT